LFLFAILTIVSCKKKKPKESIYPLSTEEVTQTPVELGKEILMEEGTVLPAIK
jgi:hypothetical protein